MDDKPLPMLQMGPSANESPPGFERDLPPPPSSPSQSGIPRNELLASESLRPTIQVPPPLDLDQQTGTDMSGLPTTPISPMPTTSSSPLGTTDGKAKKANPLVDLIDSEKAYVDQLTGIIRKVASAWSRSNMPPRDLDLMFRAVEGIYKTNRAFLSKLKDMGANPSSPKALGDLLMRWIADLEGPYTKFCSQFMTGFDSWPAVQQNNSLHALLASFSASHPPPPPPSSPEHPSEPLLWTLDSLFLLPRGRLKYYKKLYGRLLKGTAPGRSDHRLLSGALDTLDTLLSVLASRSNIHAGSSADGGTNGAQTPAFETQDEVVVDMSAPAAKRGDGSDTTYIPNGMMAGHSSDTFSPLVIKSQISGSSHPSEHRSSRETARTSLGRSSSATMTSPVTDLERRLSTARTLDLFSMKPKEVRLQMAPSSLPFTRELRMSLDVHIAFTPRSTGETVIHPRGHIYLLTDLFLVCEHMTPEERAIPEANGADMWLCYPPLAGKHVRVTSVEGFDSNLQITILKRETMVLHLESSSLRDKLVAEFRDLNEAGALAVAVSKQTPPPVPPVNSVPRFSGSMAINSRPSSSTSGPLSPSLRSGSLTPRSASPPSLRRISPMSDVGSTPRDSEQSQKPSSTSSQGFTPGMGEMALSHDVHVHSITRNSHSVQDNTISGSPRVSSSVDTFFAPDLLPSLTSGATHPPPPFQPQFSPAHVVPPIRNGSVGPGGSMPPHIRQNPLNGSMNGNLPNHMGPGFMISQANAPRAMPPFSGQHPPPRPHTTDASMEYLSSGSIPGPQGVLRKSPSGRSLGAQTEAGFGRPFQPPPMPNNLMAQGRIPGPPMQAPQPRTVLPSSAFKVGSSEYENPSPPSSPVQQRVNLGPVSSKVSAQMKCKVFLKQQHAQWKSLGVAKLKLYREEPTNVKQLVVEADNKDKAILISTIVLTDGVERVGKTGVAIELSDKGTRTGIVYMIQLRNEQAAAGLFDELLWGSDRAAGHH